MRIKIKLIYLILQKDIAIKISCRINIYIQNVIRELKRLFKTMCKTMYERITRHRYIDVLKAKLRSM